MPNAPQSCNCSINPQPWDILIPHLKPALFLTRQVQITHTLGFFPVYGILGQEPFLWEKESSECPRCASKEHWAETFLSVQKIPEISSWKLWLMWKLILFLCLPPVLPMMSGGRGWVSPTCASINPLGEGTAKPSWAPVSAQGTAATDLTVTVTSQPNWLGWPMSCTYIYIEIFLNPSAWHWSSHFCCKFLIDDSLSGSTLSQLWGSWPYPCIIYFICECFINIQAHVVSWGSQWVSVIFVAMSAFGCLKEKVFLLFHSKFGLTLPAITM